MVILLKIQAKKSLGQNFLKDENILRRITDSIEVHSNDLILEIGPGMGALTKYLVQKNSLFLAYEIDERMRPFLEKYTSHIIYGDFLKQNLVFDLKNYTYQNLYVVANIPYYITSPIIEHLINSGLVFEKIVLLVQKEVAQRFAAKPKTKDYGYFTVFLNYYFEVKKMFDVSRKAFSPVPNVDSAVVCFKKKETPAINTGEYFAFLKKCFANKRKTLKNNLNSYDWNIIFNILDRYSLSESVRAEEIPEEIFREIFLSLNP